MTRRAVTREDIFQAADHLQKTKQKVTTQNIRSELGGHGSQTTIHKHLTAWKELNAQGLTLDYRELTEQLAEQLQINSNLTTKILDLSAELATKTTENQNLELKLEHAVRSLADLRQEYQTQFMEAKLAFDAAIKVMAEQIKTINENAINKLLAAGNHFDEKIMAERLELKLMKEDMLAKDNKINELNQKITKFKQGGEVCPP